MRFIADMPIPQATVTHLKKEGYDIYHLQDKELSKAKDSEILRIARSEGRIVSTMDLDFGALLAGAIVVFEESRVRVRRLPL